MKLDALSPYYWFMKAKNTSSKDSASVGIPVISVGNINTGGSGKTPFIQFLVNEIKSKYPQKKILIISKSYKASLKHPQEVTKLDISKPDVFGDEPCLLKSLVDADVWSGPTKYKTLAAALKIKSYDLAIIDDGFSHRKIKRQLDIVLFDVSRSRAHYQIMPFGFMREPWSALKRASLVILTKLENQEIGRINFYRNEILKHQDNLVSLHFNSEIKLKEKNIFLVAGIGNPEALIQNLKQQGYQVIRSKLYEDHYEFPVTEQEKIWSEYQQSKGESDVALVTTAKDLIKLNHPEILKNIKTIELNVSMSNETLKVLHEKISQLF
jgi:tetraacyldisaccharide 4'-kinase